MVLQWMSWKAVRSSTMRHFNFLLMSNILWEWPCIKILQLSTCRLAVRKQQWVCEKLALSISKAGSTISQRSTCLKLSGPEAHTDRNESNFGPLSQQLHKELTTRNCQQQGGNACQWHHQHSQELPWTVGSCGPDKKVGARGKLENNLCSAFWLGTTEWTSLSWDAGGCCKTSQQEACKGTSTTGSSASSGSCWDSGRCNQSAVFCHHQSSQGETAENTNSVQEIEVPRQLFVFVREKWQLTILQLKTNLEAVVAGCANPALAVTEDWLIDWLMITYIALFSALLSRLTALACGSTWVTSFFFIARFLNIHRSGVLECWHGWCHMKLQPSRRKFCVHHTTMHHVTSCKATYVRCMRV